MSCALKGRAPGAWMRARLSAQSWSLSLAGAGAARLPRQAPGPVSDEYRQQSISQRKSSVRRDGRSSRGLFSSVKPDSFKRKKKKLKTSNFLPMMANNFSIFLKYSQTSPVGCQGHGGDLVDDDHLSFQGNKQSDWNLVATAQFLYLLRILSSQDP